MKCLYIPREINKTYILLWKQDEAIFLMLPFLFVFIMGGVVGFSLTLISVIVVAGLLKNLSVDKADGYIKHWIWFNMPKSRKQSYIFRGGAFPPAYIRHIAG